MRFNCIWFQHIPTRNITYWYTQWDWKITIRRVELFEGTRIYVGMFESTMFGYVWEISNWFKTQKHIIYTHILIFCRFVAKHIVKTHRFLEQAKNQWFTMSRVDQSTKEGVDFPLPNLTISLPEYIYIYINSLDFTKKTGGFTWFHMISLVKSIQFGFNQETNRDFKKRPPLAPLASRRTYTELLQCQFAGNSILGGLEDCATTARQQDGGGSLGPS